MGYPDWLHAHQDTEICARLSGQLLECKLSRLHGCGICARRQHKDLQRHTEGSMRCLKTARDPIWPVANEHEMQTSQDPKLEVRIEAGYGTIGVLRVESAYSSAT